MEFLTSIAAILVIVGLSYAGNRVGGDYLESKLKDDSAQQRDVVMIAPVHISTDPNKVRATRSQKQEQDTFIDT